MTLLLFYINALSSSSYFSYEINYKTLFWVSIKLKSPLRFFSVLLFYTGWFYNNGDKKKSAFVLFMILQVVLFCDVFYYENKYNLIMICDVMRTTLSNQCKVWSEFLIEIKFWVIIQIEGVYLLIIFARWNLILSCSFNLPWPDIT